MTNITSYKAYKEGEREANILAVFFTGYWKFFWFCISQLNAWIYTQNFVHANVSVKILLSE